MKLKNDIIGSSIVLLVMFNVFNLLNLLFQIFVAHSLEVSDYGVFTALFSFLYVCGIFSESIQLAVTKKVAQIKSEQSIKNIFDSAMKSSFLIATIVFVFYFIVFSISNSALKISWALILINSATIFLSLSSPVVRGVLQGQKRFFDLGVNMITEGSAKFFFGILFIFFGWKIYGTLGAVILSMVVPIVYGIKFQINKVIKEKKKSNAQTGNLSLFKILSVEVLSLVGSVLLLFMLDVLIARAVLSPENAGYYAIASTIAKMAFIGTQPISKAMISHVATAKNKEESRRIFNKSFAIIICVLVFGIAIASYFSTFIVSIFGGADKLAAASILPIVLIAVSLISISNLILFYKIAINKTKFYWILPLSVLLLVTVMIFSPPTLIGFALSYLAATIIFLMVSWLIIK